MSISGRKEPVTLPQLPAGGAWGQGVREYLSRQKEILFEHHRAGAAGGEIVDAYTEVMDGVMRALYEAATSEYAERYAQLDQRLAVVAQGGYGRGELNPCSDIDLLFLYPHKRDPYVDSVTERILYCLWDTKLDLGHAARNIRDCVRLAATDLKVKTALLDTRFLCGDGALYAEFAAAMDNEVLRRGAERFFREKLEENRSRHEQYGDSVYLLEPQLKEGEGGLRDLHTAMWMAKVKFKVHGMEELVHKGVLSERERHEIKEAQDFLWRVRNHLHFLSGKHQDQLTFEYQERVAEDLGFEGSGTLKPVEVFMRKYYLHAATINRFSDEIIDRCVGPSTPQRLFGRLTRREIRPGVVLAAEILSVTNANMLREDPSNLVRLFGDAQRHDVSIAYGTKRLVRSHIDLIDDEQRHAPETVAALFDVLRGRRRVYETLVDMHGVGVLGALLPEFEALRCMVLHDVYHTYTVDEHSLRGVFELERLRAGAYKASVPLLTQVVREVDGIDILFLAFLLHDIGKGHGSKHSERGAAKIPQIAARLRMNEDAARQLQFLVAHHLTMSHLAQRRDIHDQRLIVEFAKQVGTVDNLKKLYLLTFADMRAVGPKVWNNWHDMLLGQLYMHTLDVLERETLVVEDYRERVGRVKERITDAAAGKVPEDDLQAFLQDMPDRYLLGTTEDSIVRHAQLVGGLHEEGEIVVTEVHHEPDRDFTEFTVITDDRPGLFAMLAGILFAHRLDIASANINTSRAGMAVDIFRVTHGDRAELVQSPERWERVRTALERILRGEQEVEDLVAQAQEPSLFARRVVPQVPNRVEIHNEVSDRFTVVDVYSHDRPGLLFDVANALYHLGLAIHLAKITTNVDQVLDVFYVSKNNSKVTDPGDLQRMRTVLAVCLEEEVARAASA
jgi:[protein-PII] uridylyltransferase